MNQATETVVTTSLATFINKTIVSMSSQPSRIHVPQPTFAPSNLNETHVTVQLPTTTASSMSLNYTPLEQTETPPLLAQSFANAGPTTLDIFLQQPVRQAPIPIHTESFNAHTLPPQPTARMPTFPMPVNPSFLTTFTQTAQYVCRL